GLGAPPPRTSGGTARQPDERRATSGEQADRATSTGPIRWTWRTRSAHPSSGPALRLICSAAVADIIGPPGPPYANASKCRSIATYRLDGLTRRVTRAGSAPIDARP